MVNSKHTTTTQISILENKRGGIHTSHIFNGVHELDTKSDESRHNNNHHDQGQDHFLFTHFACCFIRHARLELVLFPCGEEAAQADHKVGYGRNRNAKKQNDDQIGHVSFSFFAVVTSLALQLMKKHRLFFHGYFPNLIPIGYAFLFVL